MKNLLHISPNKFPTLEKSHHTKRIWQELAKGFDEYHLLARSEDNTFKYSKAGNIHLHLLPKIIDKSRIFIVTSFFMFYLIKKYEITHLLSQCSINGGLAGVLASKFFKIPIMLEIHGDIYFKYLKQKSLNDKILTKLLQYTLTNCTKIRSLSSKMTEMLHEFGIKKNIVVIPNRVDLTVFDTPKESLLLGEPITIVSVGRFVEQKGFDIAIEAIKILNETYNIKLILVGGGKLYDALMSKRNGLGNINLINWVEQSELKYILRNADIYIQPSKSEAMPRTILEAMAMRLPIIATDVGAIPGVLEDGKNAILIKSGNQANLIEAIEKLINNDQLRLQIAKQAYKDVKEKYEWNKVFDIYRSELLSMSL